MKFKNVQNIQHIHIKPRATCYCPLGDDWYENQFDIELTPGEWVPDYCDVDRFIAENISGKSLIIEDALKILYDYFTAEYAPEYLQISSTVENAGHSTVYVEI